MTAVFRPAVVPCHQGTLWIESIGTTVIVGREHAIEGVNELLRRRVPVACDIETAGLGAMARLIKCVIFSPYPDGDCAVILDPRDPWQAQAIRLMLREAPWLFFHNSPFDVPNLGVNGLFEPEWCARVEDTMLTARLAEPANTVSKKLSACGQRYLGYDFDDSGMLTAAKAVGMRSESEMYREFDLDRPVYLRGAATDAVVTARVRDPLRAAAARRLTDHPFPGWGVEGDEVTALIEREQILNRMSLRRAVKGYAADMDYLDQYNEKFDAALHEAADALTARGVTPGNAQTLVKKLDREGFIPDGYPRTKKTGVLSGKKDDLALLQHPLAQIFVWQKEHEKVFRDYLAKARDLAVEDRYGVLRLHPTMKYFGATTGRQSVGDPPLQQFPELARGVILFDGDGTSIDWSQIEPVVVANVAGDEQLLGPYESITDETPEEIRKELSVYGTIGRLAGVKYKQAKTQTLGTLYGQGLTLTASKLGVDIPRAKEIKEAVFGAMPKVRELTYTLRQLGEDYRLIPTVSGRIIPIPMGFYEGRQSVATHKAVNYFVQGSAYDVLAEALIQVERSGLGDAVYFPMHDEVICATEAAYDIRRIMQTPPERLIRHSNRIPILRTDLAHLGERWAVA